MKQNGRATSDHRRQSVEDNNENKGVNIGITLDGIYKRVYYRYCRNKRDQFRDNRGKV